MTKSFAISHVKIPSSLIQNPKGIWTPYGWFVEIFCAAGCGKSFGYVPQEMLSYKEGYVSWLCNGCVWTWGTELGAIIKSDDEFLREQVEWYTHKLLTGRV